MIYDFSGQNDITQPLKMSTTESIFTASSRTEKKDVRTVTLTLSSKLEKYLSDLSGNSFEYDGFKIETNCIYTRLFNSSSGIPCLQFDGTHSIVLLDIAPEHKLFFDNEKKFLECFKKLTEEMKNQCFSFSISKKAYDYCYSKQKSLFIHSNGISIACYSWAASGFGNGTPNTLYLNRYGNWNTSWTSFRNGNVAKHNKDRILEALAALENEVMGDVPIVVPKNLVSSELVTVKYEDIILNVHFELSPGYDPEKKILNLDRHGPWTFSDIPGADQISPDDYPKILKLMKGEVTPMGTETSSETPKNPLTSETILIQI